MASTNTSVAIIGAGVIGVTTAAYLLREGYEITLFDHQGIAESTSSGNAAAFAYADMSPLNQPSILLKAPGWFLDPLGPLAIPPGYITKIMPWLAKFAWACRPSQVRRGTQTMQQLMTISREQARAFWPEWGLQDYIVQRGAMNVFENQRSFNNARSQWLACAEQGFEIQFLDADGIHELEPGLDTRRIKHAVRILDWPTVTDPKLYTKAIGQSVLDRGAVLVEQQVSKVSVTQDGKVGVTCENSPPLHFDKMVVCAGAWSDSLATMLGDKIPLETERGYNTTMPTPGVNLNHMLIFPEHAFVATPLEGGLRIGGANELAGTDYPPNYKRADYLLDKARAFMPGLDDRGGTQWMGCRPSLPDAQPVIDYSGISRNVIYALGHGHYGLTQSAGTAKLVLDLIQHNPPAMNMAGLKADRF